MKGIVLSLNRYLAQWQRDKIKNSHIDNGVRATTCNHMSSNMMLTNFSVKNIYKYRDSPQNNF